MRNEAALPPVNAAQLAWRAYFIIIASACQAIPDNEE
jgi:hypothetical protein